MTKSQKSTNRDLSTAIKWLPPVLWAAVIFTLSSIPQIKVSELFFWDFLLKKTAHVTEYAIFYALILKATGRKFALSYIILLLNAISDEIHQKFVPGRSPSLIDIEIDLSGANIAGYIIWKITPHFRWLKSAKK